MTELKTNDASQVRVDTWFTDVIDHIKVDHFLLSTNSAPKETKDFYDDLIHGDGGEVVSKMRGISTKFYITKIVNDYISELKGFGRVPVKLAMGLSDSKLLVWSEINDGDEDTENALLLAEAKVNSKYFKNGFYINSTIIEKSDNLQIPPHYQTIIA